MPEGVTQLGKAFAVARDEDAGLLSDLRLEGHRPLLARLRWRALRPSIVLVLELLTSSGLSDGSVTGRSCSDHSPLLTTHQNFVAWESVMASITVNPSFGLLLSLLSTEFVLGAWRTSRSRRRILLTWFWLVSGISQVPRTSTRSPSFSVPFRSCVALPGTCRARRLPLSWAWMPCSCTER